MKQLIVVLVLCWSASIGFAQQATTAINGITKTSSNDLHGLLMTAGGVFGFGEPRAFQVAAKFSF